MCFRDGRVLNFTVSISNSLKILTIGDSLSVQFSESLDEIMGGADLSSRTVLWEAWSGHIGGSIVWPTYGGGATGTFRMTALLSGKNEGKPPANIAGGGWNFKQVDRFLKHEMYGLEMVREKEFGEEMSRRSKEGIRDPVTRPTNSTPMLGKFDVVVFRTMHGWMPLEDLNPGRFMEAIHLAGKLFGAETVILQTIPFSNNVKTISDLKAVDRINANMRNVAKNWNPQNPSIPTKYVVVQEYGQYVNHVIWSNARHLGYNVSDPIGADPRVFETEGPTFLLDRLSSSEEYPPSIPMVCIDLESLGERRDKCDRNSLFSDGMHVCPENLSFRYAAGLACLVGCVYNRYTPENDGHMQECVRECNDQFMSLVPIHNDWVDDNVTLASFA